MEDFTYLIPKIDELFAQGNPHQALDLVNILLEKYTENDNLAILLSGFLIDCGDALHRVDKIQDGIKIIENFLENNKNLEIISLLYQYYNLSNGYAAQGKYYLLNNNKTSAEESFHEQKKYLQKILLSKETLDQDFQLRVLTNYGNLLDHLDRTVEAIDCFQQCLIIDPNHSMSMINLSYAIRRLFGISKHHNPKLFYHSHQLLVRASSNSNQIELVGGGHVLEEVRKHLSSMNSEAEKLFYGGLSTLENLMIELASLDSDWQLSDQLKDIYENGLFLSVNPLPLKCQEDCQDDLFFPEFLVPIEDRDDNLFKRVSHTFNNIKEDFAVARHLYFLSKSQDKMIVELSKITSYIDTLDYSDFGLRAGYLKTSLRLSFDLLGKCAICLNLYLNLGHHEDRIDFFNFWYREGKYKKGFVPEVEQLIRCNRFFAALNDVKNDLYVGEYPFPFKDIRNDATHKRIVISWFDPIDNETNTIHKLSDFQEIVLSVLKLSRAAIIYLVGCITLEERKKIEKLDSDLEFLPSIPFHLDSGLSDFIDINLFDAEDQFLENQSDE